MDKLFCPGDIACLIEYAVFPPGSPEITNRKSIFIEKLESLGLIEDDHELMSMVITDKGRAHLENLLNLPLPVQVWVLPDTDARQQEPK